MNPHRLRALALALLFVLPWAGLTSCATSPSPAQRGRLHHVGLVWLKEPGNAADRQALIDATHRFAREIPELRALSVGRALPHPSPMVDSSFDLCFVMQFDDAAAMARYNEHPLHAAAARDLFLPLASKLLFYDFVGE